MDLRNTLKALKLNEGTISTLLGALVVIIVIFLVFNFFRGRGGEEALPGEVTSPGATEQAELPATHTVSENEHLWGIAERYYKSGYNWVDIAEANEITNPNRIEVGQELTIPEVEPKTPTVDTETGLTIFGPTITGGSYTVEQGDHLWGVAVRAYGDGFAWTRLAEANNLENPNILLIGQELSIPH